MVVVVEAVLWLAAARRRDLFGPAQATREAPPQHTGLHFGTRFMSLPFLPVPLYVFEFVSHLVGAYSFTPPSGETISLARCSVSLFS